MAQTRHARVVGTRKRLRQTPLLAIAVVWWRGHQTVPVKFSTLQTYVRTYYVRTFYVRTFELRTYGNVYVPWSE